MLQEDSSSDAGFEFIDKKVGDLAMSEKDPTGGRSNFINITTPLPGPSTMSVVNSPDSKLKNVPSTDGPTASFPPSVQVSHNLPASLQPPPIPAAAASFIASTPQIPQISSPPRNPYVPPPSLTTTKSQSYAPPPPLPQMFNSPSNPQIFTPSTSENQPLPPTDLQSDLSQADPNYIISFSPAIPPSKGVVHPPPMAQEDSQYYLSQPENDEKTNNPGILTWMKGAVSTGGLLYKVAEKAAEKAKSSVGSVITTLDPQMKEYLYFSGGDNIVVTIASDDEAKISPLREAFHSVFGFGKIKIESVNVPLLTPAQLVGTANALAAAKCRINSYKQNFPGAIVALENLVTQLEDEWYEQWVLVLDDPNNSISFTVFSQMTPVPAPIITTAQAETLPNYEFASSGFATSINRILSSNLQVPLNEWHQVLTGVSLRDILFLAAKSLAGLYKSSLRL